MTKNVLLKSLALPLLLSLAACADPMTGAATATDDAWCAALQDVLPSRSRRDTAQTQTEIGTLYDFYEVACGRTIRP